MARIRAFFAHRDVLEVDVPSLSRAGTPDPAIESFQTLYTGPGHARGLPLYLHSSPEYFMKRLLVAGSGAIYQLSHVFRNGEAGRRHNPEFSMLEWYRPGFDPEALMDEIDRLLLDVLEGYLDYQPAKRVCYRHWFGQHTGLDPWTDSIETFMTFAEQRLDSVPSGMSTDKLTPWLDLIVSHWIEPRIRDEILFVHDYPPDQAALARVRAGDIPVAERFELYFNGVELANGFHELTDAGEQRQRFEAENLQRKELGLDTLPLDEYFLQALDAGLPDCSGVALGFDRLAMLASSATDIADVLPFPFGEI